ncbi:MAG: tyrosine-type recombinase/integrase [Eubacterium sp.]
MPKRGENIRKRKDKRWEGRYIKGRDEYGKAIYASVYGKTYSEVKQKLITACSEDNKTTEKHNINLSDLLSLWMKYNHIKHKGSTEAKYQYIIDKHINPEIGKRLISDLSATDINLFLNNKLEKGRKSNGKELSANYVRTMMIIIQSALNFGVQEKLCKPLQTPIFKIKSEKKNIEILNLSQQQKLEKRLLMNTTPTKLGIYLSLYTGLRIGEVCALKWCNIDFNEQVIHIRSTVTRIKCDDGNNKTKLIIDRPKTKASIRDIPIPIFICQKLLEVKKRSVSEFVTSDKPGFVNPRTYEYRYHRLLSECNIPQINYHALRHTFATRCIEATGDIKLLSEILGHSSVAITMDIYVHSSDDMKRKQIEKIANLTA